jgi:hypothetical protein
MVWTFCISLRSPRRPAFDLNAWRDKGRQGLGVCDTSKCRIRLRNHTKFGAVQRKTMQQQDQQ